MNYKCNNIVMLRNCFAEEVLKVFGNTRSKGVYQLLNCVERWIITGFCFAKTSNNINHIPSSTSLTSFKSENIFELLKHNSVDNLGCIDLESNHEDEEADIDIDLSYPDEFNSLTFEEYSEIDVRESMNKHIKKFISELHDKKINIYQDEIIKIYRSHPIIKNINICKVVDDNTYIKYSMLLIRGQSWSVDDNILNEYIKDLDIDHEAFSSSFNQKLTKNLYCSLFKSDEGSIGKFQDQNSYDGNWYINPPFVESILEMAAKIVRDSINGNWVFIGPIWKDASYYKILSSIVEPGRITDVKYIIPDGSSFSKGSSLAIWIYKRE